MENIDKKYWICIFIFAISCFWSTLLIAEEKPAYRVGVLYWSMNIPGQVAMREGLEAEASRINAEIKLSGGREIELITRVAGDGDQGIARQIEQMNELLDLKVDLLIVQPTDNVALSSSLVRANKEKIPVIAYDQYISKGKLTAYRTSDNFQAGWLDGEFIASKFSPDYQIKLILVDYPHVSSTVERLDGFLDALATAKQKYLILRSYQAVEPVSGKKAAQALLKEFPEKGSVDVVFTVNDGGGLPLAEELFKAGRNEILHATIDGDPESIENIRNQKITVIDSAQFCGPLGGETMKAAYECLTGKKPFYHALIPVFPVTFETISQYPGWRGPIPKTLKKSWESINHKWEGNLKIVKP